MDLKAYLTLYRNSEQRLEYTGSIPTETQRGKMTVTGKKLKKIQVFM